MDDLLTLPQAAQKLAIHRTTVLRLIKSRQLPAINISNTTARPRWRVSPDDLLKFIKSRRNTKAKRRAHKLPRVKEVV